MSAFDPFLEPADDDRYATWDAAYVLGSLSGADRREYETHLKACVRCRSAVSELSDIPALLDKAGPADFDEPVPSPSEPPPELLPGLLDTVRARRRRSRWLASAAVGLAAALLAVGIAVVVRPEILGLPTGAPPQAAGQQLEMAKVSETPINATVSMTGYGWGTRIDMACSYGDWGKRDAPPQDLAMVVVGRDGSRNQIATWLGLSGATALPSANTPMQMQEIAAVQLVSPDSGKVLLERSL
ncbi:zf-HC2 domain-containing protein [Mycobacterium sp. E740]|uniref:zf-HC2 domain-containing protein n=1 Tax=Mycobacterium sp. E740 TaxID=1834149 RepID=UPI0007FE0E17|nr:zf-HC2 domain-containing protein [Mycobacterium sp. E740]OBI73178.1 anti-sigma factor [Mycobacterium sp. E740]